MKGVLKLRKPITVDGKSVSEVAYNTEEITGELFCEADSKRRIAAGSKNMTVVPTAEFDFAFHLYIGYAAVCAANPGMSFEDAERIGGSDALDVMDVGRAFILRSEDSAQSSSDERSETTAEPSTQAPLTSDENE